ncbi:uncharacterized protein [Macrobrachium rosenbergii]|uniref:uncharacterized protein n=1 Tax=Macrobrachium rosenbergii TaxID=79674 RepID=UPI0034D484A9
MASFLQYALSPFPRRKNRKGDRNSTISQDTITSTSTSTTPTPTPTPAPPSPAPKTRSVGIQTPTLPRRALEDSPGTPSARRRFKEKWQNSPLMSRRASQDTLREGSVTPVAQRKAISPPGDFHSPTTSRRHVSPPPLPSSSCASLSSHEPPPTPSSSYTFTYDAPPTPTSTRRCPSQVSVDSTQAHVVHVGAAGLELGGLRGWDREVILREGGRRAAVMRESVRMSQCVVWQCLPLPGAIWNRKPSNGKDENGGPETQYSTIVRDPRTSYIAEEVRGVSTVQLWKKEGCTLGLIVAGEYSEFFFFYFFFLILLKFYLRSNFL